MLAPRAPRAAPLRLGGGEGLGQALASGQSARWKGLIGAVHADVKLIKADGSTEAFSFDRGEVTAASDKSVTVKRADGPSVTKTISSDTKLRGKLAVDGRAIVISKGRAAVAILAAGRKA